MKHILQIIALNIFGLNALQIILAFGIAVMLLQMGIQKLSLIDKWKARKTRKELEDDMWAIE